MAIGNQRVVGLSSSLMPAASAFSMQHFLYLVLDGRGVLEIQPGMLSRTSWRFSCGP